MLVPASTDDRLAFYRSGGAFTFRDRFDPNAGFYRAIRIWRHLIGDTCSPMTLDLLYRCYDIVRGHQKRARTPNLLVAAILVLKFPFSSFFRHCYLNSHIFSISRGELMFSSGRLISSCVHTHALQFHIVRKKNSY